MVSTCVNRSSSTFISLANNTASAFYDTVASAAHLLSATNESSVVGSMGEGTDMDMDMDMMGMSGVGDEPRRAQTWDEACVLFKAGIPTITDDGKAGIIDAVKDHNQASPVFRNFTTREFDVVFPFEKSYFSVDPYNYFLWVTNYWTVSLYASVIYVVVIFGLQRWMRDRKPFDLRVPLFLWNLGLAVFSIIGTHRCLSELLYVVAEHGFEHSVCIASYAFCNKLTAVWTWFFANSKILELGDTIFIVLRKQRLLFLHWYHHITVLIYTYYSMSTFTAQGRWFVSCNLLVHSAMYSYYALRAMKVRVPRNVAMAVTSSQLLQMIVGIYINWTAYRLKRQMGPDCSVAYENIVASFLMYLSYFVLFGKFFYDAYINKRSAIHKPKVQQVQKVVDQEEDQLKAIKESAKKVANGAVEMTNGDVRQRRPPAQAAR